MEERRKFERFTLALPANIETVASGRKRDRFDFLTSDVSGGGAFFNAEERIPAGTRVRLKVIVSSESLKDLTGAQGYLRVEGTVVRSDSKGMAVRFDEQYRFQKMDDSLTRFHRSRRMRALSI